MPQMKRSYLRTTTSRNEVKTECSSRIVSNFGQKPQQLEGDPSLGGICYPREYMNALAIGCMSGGSSSWGKRVFEGNKGKGRSVRVFALTHKSLTVMLGFPSLGKDQRRGRL